MSYNPHRHSKKRTRTQPNSRFNGTKRSDIARRQGLGAAVTISSEDRTAHGYANEVFKSKKFTVRNELIAAGNAYPFGKNAKQDRVYHVISGTLVVTHDNGDETVVTKFPPGNAFVAERNKAYSVASMNAPVELVVVEDTGYAKNFKIEQQGVVAPVDEEIFSAGPTAPATARRKDQSKAKSQAITAAKKRARKTKPKLSAGPTQAVTGPGIGQSVGRNITTNANSHAVDGVNPMPGGPGAYRD